VSIANGLPAPFTVTVLTSGGAILPPPIPRRFVPPAGIRVLFLRALAVFLLKATKNRWIFDNHSARGGWHGAALSPRFSFVQWFMRRAAAPEALPPLRRPSSRRPAPQRSLSPWARCLSRGSRCNGSKLFSSLWPWSAAGNPNFSPASVSRHPESTSLFAWLLL